MLPFFYRVLYMQKKFRIILICFLCVALAGCAGASYSEGGQKLINGKPDWYYSPSKNGKIGGVGVCGMHVDGKTGQKKLAVERALAEIARQMGVKVQSFSALKSQTAAGSSSVQGETHSFFTVDGKTVNAHIEKMWEDPYTDELYVWMVAE